MSSTVNRSNQGIFGNKTLVGLALAGLLTLLPLGGCASIIAGSSQTVAFTSNPSGARVQIVNKKGSVIHEGTTPFTTSLKRGGGFFQAADLSLRADLQGHESVKRPIKSELEPWYIGNLLFGGLPGMLIVDPLTGAMFKFPDTVKIDMNGGATASDTNKSAVELLSLDSIPENQRASLIRLN